MGSVVQNRAARLGKDKELGSKRHKPMEVRRRPTLKRKLVEWIFGCGVPAGSFSITKKQGTNTRHPWKGGTRNPCCRKRPKRPGKLICCQTGCRRPTPILSEPRVGMKLLEGSTYGNQMGCRNDGRSFIQILGIGRKTGSSESNENRGTDRQMST